MKSKVKSKLMEIRSRPGCSHIFFFQNKLIVRSTLLKMRSRENLAKFTTVELRSIVMKQDLGNIQERSAALVTRSSHI